jgi:hypothetical protein
MSGLKPVDYASFISSESNRSAYPIRVPMWK